MLRNVMRDSNLKEFNKDKMKRKDLLKLIIGVSLAAVMTISVPLMSGCAAPAPAPTPTPEPTPTPTPTPEPAAEEPTYNLRFQGYHEPIELGEYFDYLWEDIEEMSGGRLKIKPYAMDELVAHTDALTAIQTGTLDIALWGSALNPITETAPFECTPAFMWENPDEFQALYWKRGLREIFNKAYEPFNAYWITNWIDDPMSLVSIPPVRTYEDLEGLRISTMPEYVRVYGDAGAIVVEMAIEEYYIAGETGVIDAINWASGIYYKKVGLNELFTHLVDPPMTTPWQGNIIINKELWDGMPPDLQKILSYAFIQSSMDSWARQYSAYTHYCQYYDMCYLSDEDVAKMVASSMSQWAEWAERGPLAKQAYDLMMEYFAETEEARWYR